MRTHASPDTKHIQWTSLSTWEVSCPPMARQHSLLRKILVLVLYWLISLGLENKKAVLSQRRPRDAPYMSLP